METKTFGEQLLESIRAAGYPSQRQFAQAIDMDPTYLSRIIKGGVNRPERETLEKMADKLRVPYDELARMAGALPQLSEAPPPPPPIQLPLTDPDEQFDPEAIVAYVESRPGVGFQARLRAQRERRSREAYVRFCVSLFRAWSSNSYLALDAAEMSEQPR